MTYLSKLLITMGFLMSLPSFAAYEAHEWGTFTSLVGSDGITQNGMYHEDEPLPSFVHPFGELRAEPIPPPFRYPGRNPIDNCRGKACFGNVNLFETNQVTQKMETPVIYFYSEGTQALDVEVNVKFPEGIVTETYPGPVRTFPRQNNITRIADGDTTFEVQVQPYKASPNLNYVSSQNIYSHARHVDSNIVTSGIESEKFIFYRGIGRFQPRINITSKKGQLSLVPHKGYVPQAVFLVHVNKEGEGQLITLNPGQSEQEQIISASTIAKLKDHSGAQSSFVKKGSAASEEIVKALIKSGLRTDEAQAMVNTWEHGYLKVPGLRLLYILPEHEVDEVLPLTLTPAPKKIVRSFVGRIEVLLDSDEQNLIYQIERAGRSFKISSLGRFAEPMLRRVFEVYKERSKKQDHILSLFEDLIREASDITSGASNIQ